MRLFKFPLPDIGEGVAEGEIVEWRIAEGDVIAEDQVICEVMTDKATVEITTPVEGKVVALKAAEGATVPVGGYILHIDVPEGVHIPEITRHGEHHDDVDDAVPVVEEAPAAAKAPAAATAPVSTLEVARTGGRRALATPYTRKLARTLGLDIERIRGTGDAGRVTTADVEAYAAALGATSEAPTAAIHDEEPAPAPAAATAPAPRPVPAPAPIAVVPGGETRIPIKGLRKRISERMRMSKQNAAHFTYVEEIDVTDLVEMRRRLREPAAAQGVKLTYLPFILKALVSGFRVFPTLNGVTDDARNEFVVKHSFNFGIAVDTDAGLIVPVVKGVDQRGLVDLAREIDRVAGDARDGRSKLEDLQDGTFTVTNAGNIGGLLATPVINYPEAAILGVHAIRKKPWIVDGTIVPRDIMYLSISIDHRMNDGATGARFINHVKALLEHPERLLLEI